MPPPKDAFQRFRDEIGDRADRHFHRWPSDFMDRLGRSFEAIEAHDSGGGQIRAAREPIDALLEISSLTMALATRLQMQLDAKSEEKAETATPPRRRR